MDLNDEFSSFLFLNGYIYATGTYSGLLFVYHPDKNEWQDAREPCIVCWGSCGVSDGRHIYFIGGTWYNSAMDVSGSTTVQRFDPRGESWEEIAAMNEARQDAFGAAMNGKIYVAGGKTCEVYNPSTNEWQLISTALNVNHVIPRVWCAFKDPCLFLGA